MSSRKPITGYPLATIISQAWSGGGAKRMLGFYFQSQSEYIYRRGEKTDPGRQKRLAGGLVTAANTDSDLLHEYEFI